MIFKKGSTPGGLPLPLDVSQVDPALLANSPLTNVTCQLRFDPTPRASEARIAQELRTRLGGESRFPRIDSIAEASLAITVGQNAPPVSQQVNATGWRLRSGDGKQAVSLLPSSVALEVSDYQGWESYRAELEAVLTAVAECVEPVFEQRLGLRYINQLTVPEVRRPDEWHGYIDDAFLGIGSHEELGALVGFTRQQAVLELDDEARCTLNHGFAPDESRDRALTYVLDYDVAREGTRLFDIGGLREAADRFNAYALRLFQITTTPAMRELLTS